MVDLDDGAEKHFINKIKLIKFELKISARTYLEINPFYNVK